MSRIPKPIARKIDRCSRRAHCFHRFAHHPLCAEYAGEVFRFGRVRLCKGCSLVILGGAAGTTSGLLAPGLDPRWSALLTLAGIPLLAWLFSKGRFISKAWTRFLPAFGGACLVVLGVRGGGWLGFAAAGGAMLAALAGWIAYRRRGPARVPCRTCADQAQAAPCRGVREILRRERAFRRVANRWIANPGRG